MPEQGMFHEKSTLANNSRIGLEIPKLLRNFTVTLGRLYVLRQKGTVRTRKLRMHASQGLKII
jgi:hypothetical protein